MAVQLPVLKDILKAMNITLIEKEGYEADDILGTLSKRASDEFDVVVLTGDRDMLQLITDKCTVNLPSIRQKR